MSGSKSVWTANVLTLFPEMFPGPLGGSIAGRAQRNNLWSLHIANIRDCSFGTTNIIDDAPYGGGAGLVMRPDVIDCALTKLIKTFDCGTMPIIYLTPRGRPLTQAKVRKLSGGGGMIVLCGRYEGIDERAINAWGMDEISVGDYVLSGGEPAAISLIDACVRLLPGVMGSELSKQEESFEEGLLEYPLYTRPQKWGDRTVPDVLLSGHHEEVRAWRLEKAKKITRERRPDLWDQYNINRGQH